MSRNEYVILAAGNGTRLWPVTNDIPKCLVRILEKPLINWIIDAINPDAEKIIIIVGDKKEQVIENFKDSPLLPKLKFVEQLERTGTASAILQAEGEISKPNFFVLNADTFAEKEFFKTLQTQSEINQPFIMGKKSLDAKRFGVLEIQEGRLKNLTEKPQDIEEGTINTGTYFLPKEFFQYLKKVERSKRGEFEATDALVALAKDRNVGAVTFEGYWNDIGYYWNYLEANNFALSQLNECKIEGQVEKNVSINGNLILGQGSIIKSGSVIEGNTTIGENCIIGPNALISTSTIEKNCRIGMSELKRSIVLKNSNLPHFNYAGDSIIGENCNLGAGSKIANLRFDEKTIRVDIKGKKIETHKTKLGACIGNNTKTGINTSINCGTIIEPNSRIIGKDLVK